MVEITPDGRNYPVVRYPLYLQYLPGQTLYSMYANQWCPHHLVGYLDQLKLTKEAGQHVAYTVRKVLADFAVRDATAKLNVT